MTPRRSSVITGFVTAAGLTGASVCVEDAVLDHLQRAAGAFAGTEVLHDELLVGFPVVVVRGVLLEWRQDGKGNEFLLQLGLAGAVEEGQQVFPVLAVAAPDGEDVRERRGDVL